MVLFEDVVIINRDEDIVKLCEKIGKKPDEMSIQDIEDAMWYDYGITMIDTRRSKFLNYPVR